MANQKPPIIPAVFPLRRTTTAARFQAARLNEQTDGVKSNKESPKRATKLTYSTEVIMLIIRQGKFICIAQFNTR